VYFSQSFVLASLLKIYKHININTVAVLVGPILVSRILKNILKIRKFN